MLKLNKILSILKQAGKMFALSPMDKAKSSPNIKELE